MTVEEVRQLSAELRARREATESLRRALRGTGVDTRDLDRIIARLEALDGATVLGDPTALAALRDGVIESLKAFEFALRQRLGGETGTGPALGGRDRVPVPYRAWVDEYFRSLARSRELRAIP